MKRRNLLYAQSGGVTSVINASAAGVIAAARAHPDAVGQVLAARHGILGVLDEDLLDCSALDENDRRMLMQLPGGAFGSCRFDLDEPAQHPAQFDRLIAVFAAHDIGYFLYNGGNGSMDTVMKVSAAARARNYPLTCVGVPKTVDNDLLGTDCSPGFGSAAKYLATSMREAGLDIRSMTGSRGRVFVMEVMGRNCGWLAASTVLARRDPDDPPHLILFPERPFDEKAFQSRVKACVDRLGYCVISASEGVRHADGTLLIEQEADPRGYIQLGGVGQCLARRLHDIFGYKHHWTVPDYLQRAAGHLVSATDRAQAEAVGWAAVQYAVAGRDAVMPGIVRRSDMPYRWEIAPRDLGEISNLERQVPPEFISECGFDVSETGLRWLRPLVEGEAPPPYVGGLPDYRLPECPVVPAKLEPYRR